MYKNNFFKTLLCSIVLSFGAFANADSVFFNVKYKCNLDPEGVWYKKDSNANETEFIERIVSFIANSNNDYLMEISNAAAPDVYYVLIDGNWTQRYILPYMDPKSNYIVISGDVVKSKNFKKSKSSYNDSDTGIEDENILIITDNDEWIKFHDDSSYVRAFRVSVPLHFETIFFAPEGKSLGDLANVLSSITGESIAFIAIDGVLQEPSRKFSEVYKDWKLSGKTIHFLNSISKFHHEFDFSKGFEEFFATHKEVFNNELYDFFRALAISFRRVNGTNSFNLYDDECLKLINGQPTDEDLKLRMLLKYGQMYFGYSQQEGQKNAE